jgi:hypothetical protein
MNIYNKHSQAYRSAKLTLMNTIFYNKSLPENAKLFDETRLSKLSASDLDYIIRLSEAAKCITLQEIAGIEDGSSMLDGKPQKYRWKFAKAFEYPHGYVFMNPDNPNEYHARQATNKSLWYMYERIVDEFKKLEGSKS